MPHERAILLVFCHPTVVGGRRRRPLPPLMGDRSDPSPFKNRSRRQISACNVSTVRASEKSSIMTNRKSYTCFPTSLPKGGSKSELFLFGIRVNFNWMKSATKFLWEKTSSSKVVVHSFPYLTVHRCWGKHLPFNLKCSVKVTHPLTKRCIGDISACIVPQL